MLDKILKFFGALVLIGEVASLVLPDSKPRETQVKSVAATQVQTADSKKNTLADHLHLKVTKIEGEQYNEIAHAYNEAAMTIAIDNSSGKTMKGFSGTLTIKDAFGDVVSSAGYKHDEDVPPGTITEKISLHLNLFDKSAQKIVDITKWTAEFRVDTILTE